MGSCMTKEKKGPSPDDVSEGFRRGSTSEQVNVFLNPNFADTSEKDLKIEEQSRKHQNQRQVVNYEQEPVRRGSVSRSKRDHPSEENASRKEIASGENRDSTQSPHSPFPDDDPLTPIFVRRVTKRQKEWFQENVSSSEIKQYLNSTPSGTFVVTPTKTDDYNLNVHTSEDNFKEYTIAKVGDFQYRLELEANQPTFSDIVELVNYYKHSHENVPFLLKETSKAFDPVADERKELDRASYFNPDLDGTDVIERQSSARTAQSLADFRPLTMHSDPTMDDGESDSAWGAAPMDYSKFVKQDQSAQQELQDDLNQLMKSGDGPRRGSVLNAFARSVSDTAPDLPVVEPKLEDEAQNALDLLDDVVQEGAAGSLAQGSQAPDIADPGMSQQDDVIVRDIKDIEGTAADEVPVHTPEATEDKINVDGSKPEVDPPTIDLGKENDDKGGGDESAEEEWDTTITSPAANMEYLEVEGQAEPANNVSLGGDDSDEALASVSSVIENQLATVDTPVAKEQATVDTPVTKEQATVDTPIATKEQQPAQLMRIVEDDENQRRDSFDDFPEAQPASDTEENGNSTQSPDESAGEQDVGGIANDHTKQPLDDVGDATGISKDNSNTSESLDGKTDGSNNAPDIGVTRDNASMDMPKDDANVLTVDELQMDDEAEALPQRPAEDNDEQPVVVAFNQSLYGDEGVAVGDEPPVVVRMESLYGADAEKTKPQISMDFEDENDDIYLEPNVPVKDPSPARNVVPLKTGDEPSSRAMLEQRHRLNSMDDLTADEAVGLEEAIYEVPVSLSKSEKKRRASLRSLDGDADEYSSARGIDTLVTLQQTPLWLHGDISRRRTERLITDLAGGKDGVFLVRSRKPSSQSSSEKQRELFALSFSYHNRFEHHLISLDPNDTYSIKPARHIPLVVGAKSVTALVEKIADTGVISSAVIIPRVKSKDTDFPVWFHGTISRKEAISRLGSASRGNGRFLVRWSPSVVKKSQEGPTYVLSMLWDRKVFNHLIVLKKGEWYINSLLLVGCSSLEEVIEMLSVPRNDFSQILRTFVPPPPPYKVTPLHRLSIPISPGVLSNGVSSPTSTSTLQPSTVLSSPNPANAPDVPDRPSLASSVGGDTINDSITSSIVPDDSWLDEVDTKLDIYDALPEDELQRRLNESREKSRTASEGEESATSSVYVDPAAVFGVREENPFLDQQPDDDRDGDETNPFIVDDDDPHPQNPFSGPGSDAEDDVGDGDQDMYLVPKSLTDSSEKHEKVEEAAHQHEQQQEKQPYTSSANSSMEADFLQQDAPKLEVSDDETDFLDMPPPLPP